MHPFCRQNGMILPTTTDDTTSTGEMRREKDACGHDEEANRLRRCNRSRKYHFSQGGASLKFPTRDNLDRLRKTNRHEIPAVVKAVGVNQPQTRIWTEPNSLDCIILILIPFSSYGFN
jgi:hypothetical protein